MKSWLELASQKYYEGDPFLTDEEFDRLSSEYSFNQVGHKVNPDDVKHLYRLYSLKKIYDTEEFPLPKTKLVSSVKLDGAAVSLLYINGQLVTGLTRGNGIKGKDITDKVKLIPSIPNSIKNKKLLQIDGEVVTFKETTNARNYAAGALNLKDLSEFKTKELYFIAYNIHPYVTQLYSEDMLVLQELGFLTILTCPFLDKFPNDGEVWRLNSNSHYEKLGYTNTHPRGAFAVKQSSDTEIVETVLTDVIWQVGASGKVTPVGIFNEVNIGGAKVSRATLHNLKYIADLDLFIGDIILVTRRGGIIPAIIGKQT